MIVHTRIFEVLYITLYCTEKLEIKSELCSLKTHKNYFSLIFQSEFIGKS